MYDVYINEYKRNGAIVSGWRNICSVPSNNDNGFEISSPSVKCSEDNADSFDFSIEMNSQYYDSLIPLKTLVRVKYGDDIIFYGRVLTIDNSSIYQTKRVHCEGAFAFFNDTYYEGIQEADKQKISFLTYYTRIIHNHNSMLINQYSPKGISKGYITVDGTTPFIPTSEERKYEPSNWTQTSSLLSSLTSEFGGHMLVHYRSGGLRLDWYKYYSRDLGADRPTVSVGENIIDISTSSSNIDKIFSYVTPIGDAGSNGKPVYLDGYTYIDKNGTSRTISGKSIPVSIIRNVYTDEQLTDEFHSASDYGSAESNYGVIYKTQTFSSAKTQEELWNYTIKWIKDCYFGIASSFTVRAYDMHIIDQTKSRILVGDCVNVQYIIMENGVKTTKTKKLVCKAASYDLFNPDNNSYTFGIPSEILNRSYSEGRGKSGSEQAGGGGGGGGSGDDKDIELTFDGIAEWIRAAAGKPSGNIYGGNIAAQSFIDNGEVTGTAKVYDPESLPQGHTIDQHKDLIFNATIVGKITATGRNIYVATNPTMGCFAFIGARPTSLSGALPITFWYLRTGKKQKVNYTPPSLMYTEEEEKLIHILEDFGINIENRDDLHDKVNNFYIGLNDNIKGFKTQVWDPVTQKVTEPFKLVIDGLGGIGESIAGFLGLNGNNSKVRVTSDDKNSGSKGVEIDGGDGTILGGIFGSAEDFLANFKLDGNNGTVNAGKDNEGNWKTVMNDTITWVDEHGVEHTTDGFVNAMDFAVREIPSFKTQFAAFGQLIANKATLQQLYSIEGRIDTLESDSITTTNMSAKNVTFRQINGVRVNANEINALQHFILPNGVYLEAQGVWKINLVDNNDGTYTLKEVKLNGDERTIGTFNRAGGSTIGSVGWSGGTFSVKDTNDVVLASTTLQAISPVPNSPIQKSGKVVYRQHRVMYGPDDEHTYPTGLVGTVSLDASSVFDDGWMKAILDCEFPSTGTPEEITIKMPNNETVEGTPRQRTYTISVDNDYAYLKRTDSGMSAPVARTTNPAFQNGKNAVKLELSWNGQNDIGTVSKVATGNKNSLSFAVSAAADIVYNSSTHKYKAISQAKIDNVARGDEGEKYSGTEAYEDGIAFGKNACGLTISSRDAKIKLNTSSNAITEVQILQSLGTLDKTTGNRTVSITAGSVANFLSSVISDYATGWNDAVGKNSIPAAGTGASFSASWPNSTLSTGKDTKTYTLDNDGNNGVLISDGTNTIAKFTHGKYDSGISAVKLALSWNGQNDTGTVSKVTSGSTKNSIEFVVSAAADITYNSSTHKYKAISQAKIDGTSRGDSGEKYSGIEAYEDGWDGCYGTVKLDNTTTKNLDFGESVTVKAQAKDKGGTLRDINARVVNAPAYPSLSAGVSSPTWDSGSKKFVAYGYAYDGSALKATSGAGYSNALSLDVGSLSGNTGDAIRSRTVKVNHGTAEILSSNITDYTTGYSTGFDADHNPRITYGSTGSCNGDFEMARGVKAHSSKTDGSTQASAGYWYVPGCHLVVLSSTPSSYISNLGFGSYIEVIGVNHDGSQQHFGKIWRIPPASEAYPNTIALKQQAGYAGASKMVMYYKDNEGNYHAAGGGASLAWYMSAKSIGNTSSYMTFRYE